MPRSKSQYLVNQTSTGYDVIKCDEDFNLLETYQVVKDKKYWFCSCPSSVSPCRHLKMIEIFRRKKAIGKGMFYCYDTKEWTVAKEFC